MADSVSLHITDEERVTVNTVLEDARDLFPDVNISVEGPEINLTGDVYDHMNKCKTFFEVKLGRKQIRTRRLAVPDMHDEEDPYTTLRRHEHSKYVTYEKISVVVVKADLLDFDGKIDCFVNTTNSKLERHSQVSKLFREAGGEPYETACEQVRLESSKLRTTQCLATEAGNMKTKYVIHALCPSQADYGLRSNKKEMENDVFSTVFNCLEMAEKLDCQSIAFSFLSTDEKEFKKRLKEAMEMIFSKLKRHKRRHIQSIAIPLLGIDSVENVEIVGKCCKWQIEKVVEILQRREEIANLQEVYLINRCETITNTLITELKIILPT